MFSGVQAKLKNRKFGSPHSPGCSRVAASEMFSRVTSVNQAKYVGMDVHRATISVAVMDSAGKLILESILETKRFHDSAISDLAFSLFGYDPQMHSADLATQDA
jgi:hypothetical protein